jgi:XTP/dITP diphosphohydrolase
MNKNVTRRLVLASANEGKLREISQLLAPLDWEVVPQVELQVPDVEETGLSFVENAIIKARNAALHSGLPALADDSGLEVDALQGAPGIYSARYAGEGATDQENLDLLLERLQNTPKTKRNARFQCLMVYVRNDADPTPIICQGTWEGRIVDEASGDNGFGYDPVFYISKQQCTAAQIEPDLKNRLSHRGQALSQMIERLSKQ